jgi:hypothetical protein
MDYSGKLMTEAVVVGVALLPVYVLTKKFITVALPRMSGVTQEYTSIVVCGGLFHLICEGSGVNDWYLDNGVAVLKRMEKEQVDWTESLNDPALCDGSCGWQDDGICSHFSFHTSPFY